MMDGSGGSWWWLAVPFMFLCMVMMMRMMGGHGGHASHGGHGSHGGDASGEHPGGGERILAERLARGEIDVEEYEQRLAALHRTGHLEGT